jgi:uncharacterized protein (TIGR03118 family)
MAPNAPGAKGVSSPTGIVLNGTTDFMITNVAGKTPAPASFIFATLNGTISAWNPDVTPEQLAVNEVIETGAVFTGLTLAEAGGHHFLVAANFSKATIEVFDTNVKRLAEPGGTFADDGIPSGFAPYNVRVVGENLVVTYAKQNAAKNVADDNCGKKCGFVDLFSKRGVLVQRLENISGVGW